MAQRLTRTRVSVSFAHAVGSGAGFANLIFLAPGSVVAELCPLGYCTQSYQRISSRVGVTYMRWTNDIAENAKPGYDTIVDPPQFVALMRRAVRAWHKAPSTRRSETSAWPKASAG